MIESARSTDCTPPSRDSESLSAPDFGSIGLRRITFRFIATCIHPSEHDGPRLSRRPANGHLAPLAGRGRSRRLRVRGTLHTLGSRRVPLTPTLPPQAGRGSRCVWTGPPLAPTFTLHRAPRPATP